MGENGITIGMVKQTLGVAETNLGGLCTSENVNPWSVWKPISSKEATLTRAIIKSADYGVSMLNATTAESLLRQVQENNNMGYVYNKPTGNNYSPYRLGDFRNYNHKAPIPIHPYYKDGDEEMIGSVSESWSRSINGLVIEVPQDLDSTDYLTIGHIYPKTDKDFNEYTWTKGALVTDGTNTFWSVGSIPWGNTYWQRFKGKNCIVLEFLTNLESGKSSLNHTSTSDDRFYSIPEPLHTIYVSSTTPAGSKDVFVDGKFNKTELNKVVCDFCFSSIGEVYTGGTLRNVYVGIYEDIDCTRAIINQKIADSVVVGNEEKSERFTYTFSNNSGLRTVYVGIHWNYQLKYSTIPLSILVDDKEVEPNT